MRKNERNEHRVYVTVNILLYMNLSVYVTVNMLMYMNRSIQNEKAGRPYLATGLYFIRCH